MFLSLVYLSGQAAYLNQEIIIKNGDVKSI